MKICICDDEVYIHNEIKEMIETYRITETHLSVTSLFSGEELLKHYSNQEYFDIIFLDVEMDAVNGIQVAETIRKNDSKAIIIFISNHSQYVFDVFKLEALHFIRKPIDYIEFSNVFQRAVGKYKSLNSIVVLKWQSNRFPVAINDITYIEGYNRHLTVHTKDGKFETIGKISDILLTLEPHGFIRIHQGFIVNMDYIKCFDKNDVVLKDKTKIMISVRKRSEALKAYDIYLQNWKW